jgi:class 3 adenylate cyclase/CHASE2 domain-containing sensor protein
VPDPPSSPSAPPRTILAHAEAAVGRGVLAALRILRRRVTMPVLLAVTVTVALGLTAVHNGVDFGLEQEVHDQLQAARLRVYPGGIRVPPSNRGRFADAESLPRDRSDPRWAAAWDVALITMDEASYEQLDGAPFTPREDARVVQTLAAFGADVIAYDRLFFEHRRKMFPRGLDPLAEAVGQALERGVPTVLAGSRVLVEAEGGDAPATRGPVPALTATADTGLINLAVETDDSGAAAVRRYPYLIAGEPSFALAAYLRRIAPDVAQGDALTRVIRNADAVTQNPLLAPYLAAADPAPRPLDFYGPPGRPFVRISYADVYRAYAFIAVAAVREKVLDAAEVLTSDDFVEAWAAIGDDFGPRPGPAQLEREPLPELLDAWTATIDDLFAAAGDEADPDSPRAIALGNAEFLLGDAVDVLSDYPALTAEAREFIAAERGQTVATILQRRDTLAAAIDEPGEVPVLAAALWLGSADPGAALTPPELETRREAVATALDARLDGRFITGLELLAAALAHLALLDRQLTRLQTFPLPPDPDEQALRRRLAGKVAMIGPWSLDSHDLWRTPVSGNGRSYGVEIHATALQNLIDALDPNAPAPVQRGITFSEPADAARIIVIAALIACLIAIAAPTLTAGALTLFGGWVYWEIAQQTAVADALFLPIVQPLGVALLGFIAVTVAKAFSVDRDRKQVESLFVSYLDPRIVDRLKIDPDAVRLGGERRELSIFFSDLAGFSRVSEGLEPEDLVLLLNEYLGAMTRVILDHGGTVDKYIGDAIMAFWNAPIEQRDHATRACLAALDQRQALAQLQEDWSRRGLPRLDFRAGINTGECVHGNMGSDLKKNYTLMGDEVNVAARFEPLNKEFGTRLIIGERTCELAGDAIEARRLGLVQVAGRSAPVGFFELLARSGDLDEIRAEVVSRFAEGLDAYIAGDFAAARAVFDRCDRLAEPIGGDGPSRRYRALCDTQLTEPPDARSWTGVYVQQGK